MQPTLIKRHTHPAALHNLRIRKICAQRCFIIQQRHIARPPRLIRNLILVKRLHENMPTRLQRIHHRAMYPHSILRPEMTIHTHHPIKHPHRPHPPRQIRTHQLQRNTPRHRQLRRPRQPLLRKINRQHLQPPLRQPNPIPPPSIRHHQSPLPRSQQIRLALQIETRLHPIRKPLHPKPIIPHFCIAHPPTLHPSALNTSQKESPSLPSMRQPLAGNPRRPRRHVRLPALPTRPTHTARPIGKISESSRAQQTPMQHKTLDINAK